MKKIVERTCIGCNKKKDKKELIRIVKNKEGTINIDKTGKLPGRGAYICGDRECTEKIIKQKKLNKTFCFKSKYFTSSVFYLFIKNKNFFIKQKPCQ